MESNFVSFSWKLNNPYHHSCGAYKSIATSYRLWPLCGNCWFLDFSSCSYAFSKTSFFTNKYNMKTTSYYLSDVFIGVMHLRPFSHFIIFARFDSDFRIFSKSNFNVLTNTYILYENNFLLFVTCFYWSHAWCCGISSSRPKNRCADAYSTSVNSIVEYHGAGLGRLTTIDSELNGAI